MNPLAISALPWLRPSPSLPQTGYNTRVRRWLGWLRVLYGAAALCSGIQLPFHDSNGHLQSVLSPVDPTCN